MGKIASLITAGMPLDNQTRALKLDAEFAGLAKKVVILEAQIQKLEAEVNPLKREVVQLKEKIAQLTTSKEYFKESGALFKRRENGEWDHTPYCPSCKTAMVAPNRTDPYVCGKKSCGQRASFNKLHVDDAINRLPSR